MPVRSSVAVSMYGRPSAVRWAGWAPLFLLSLAACATPQDDFAAGSVGVGFPFDAGLARDAAAPSPDASHPATDSGSAEAGAADDASDDEPGDAEAPSEASADASDTADASGTDAAPPPPPPVDAAPPPVDAAPPADASTCATMACLTPLECAFAGCAATCVNFHCQ